MKTGNRKKTSLGAKDGEMGAGKYHLLLAALIAPQDAGQLENLNTDEVRLYAHAGAASILLGGTFPGAAGSLSEEDWKTLNSEVAAMAFQPYGGSPRKGGALLMTWMLQGIGQHM